MTGRRAPVPKPIRELAKAGSRIAGDERVEVPHADREDEYGVLARALQAVQEASTARRALVEHAPLGIMRVRRDGVVLSANRALLTMYGYRRREDLVGLSFMELIHPEDREKEAAKFASLLESGAGYYEFEQRGLRGDGGTFWSLYTVSPVRGLGGEVESYIAIIEDISDRKQQAERAARVQRQLLPQTAPSIEGYEVAGRCLPAQDVAGDFFDWVLTDDGHLDITLADVMGKGFAAAMVMATLRTALRIVPRELGPAERARLAASSMVLTLEEGEGLFVTLFQARLHLASGRLRYLDAGHGHWAIRRRTGEIERPAGPSAVPLFVMPDLEMEEGEARLEPGDALLLYSDGLVEVEDHVVSIDHYAPGLDDATGAEDMVARLMRGSPAHQDDDVTIVVVRRR